LILSVTIRIKDLKNGDLLLCYGWGLVAVAQGAAKSLNRLTLGTVKTGAELLRAVPNAAWHGLQGRTIRPPVIFEHGDHVGIGKGTFRCNHAMIAVNGGTEVAHATGDGCVYADLELYLNDHKGSVTAFRLRPPSEETRMIGNEAGMVGKTWAVNVWDRSSAPSYSITKAFSAAFSSHSYGPAAVRRAEFYRLHKGTAGGPPSEARVQIIRSSGKKEWFCSMFAIACLQAGMATDGQRRRYLPLDARNTTPMVLDGFVRGSMHWQELGTVTLR
jgi:hypothetical protein